MSSVSPSSLSSQRINAAASGIIRRIFIQCTAIVLVLQFLANIFIPDHEADAFRTLIPPPNSSIDAWIRLFFDGLQRWDAQHYLHVAQYGYTFEHSIAFFPFFPVLIHAFACVWYSFVPSSILSFPTALMISGVVLNVGAFFGGAWSLFLLTKSVLWSNDHHQNSTNSALLATILFLLNPANIFFRAVYTESIYSFLTFLGLHCLLYKRSSGSQIPGRNLLESAICFGLALTVRSNGLLNLGYLAFYYAACWLRPFLAVSGRSGTVRGGRIRLFTFRRHVKELLPTVPVFALALVSSLAPFIAAQYYQYQTFCTRSMAKRVQISYDIATMAATNGYILPGDLPNLHWCRNESAPSSGGNRLFPTLPYTAVQAKYWRVGFLGYYSLRKVPLFVLASPTFVVAVGGCVHYLTEMRLSKPDWLSIMVNPYGLLPFILHVIFLTVVAAVFINVEVFTRMLFSSTPLIYWYCTTFFVDTKQTAGDSPKAGRNLALELETVNVFGMIRWFWYRTSVNGKLLLIYFLAYNIIGTIAFANFLPWT